MSIPLSRTLDEIRQELFAHIASVQQAGWLPQALNLNRGVVRGLIEIWAFGLYQLYQFLALVLRQAFPDTATGKWLDLHAKAVGLSRLPASQAVGKVYFIRAASTGNVVIPTGRVVRTQPDGNGQVYRFVTTESRVLQEGQTEVAVPVICETYGSGGNITPGGISVLATTVPGIGAVENRPGWLVSEGADAEGDDALQLRYQLRWESAGGSTQAAYAAWARAVPGVVAVRVLDRHPRGQGTVDLVVRGSAGIPTPALLEQVRLAVDAERPINDDVLVKGPVPVPVAIRAELELVHGTPGTVADVASRRVAAMFRDPSDVPGVAPLGIGEDLTLDRLRYELMSAGGIRRIDLASPCADVLVQADGLAVLEGVWLTTRWSGEAE
ncbi:MAG: baseplate J/gp47 family protein [Desulfovibrio desulfuricans]|jgi:uncharacterized phage protein gp47/JayE|nr:baseplate J/gp47 family protein [Desulfovibrio desulfuricans]